MPSPIEAYREGYEKGRRDNIAGNTMQAVWGMLEDDPGGFFAAGYRDGAGGKPFNPPSQPVRRTANSIRHESGWAQILFGGLIWFAFVPIHLLISLCRKQPNRPEIAWRGLMTVLWGIVIGVGAYQAHRTSSTGRPVQMAGGPGAGTTNIPKNSPSKSSYSRSKAFGPNSVWKFTQDRLWENIQEKCSNLRNQQPAFTRCVTSNMQQAGASAQAIAFTQDMKGEVYMGTFRKMGKVDLATKVAPLLNDPNTTDFILVNGTPRIVQLWDYARNTDLARDPLYTSMRTRFPQITLWPMQRFTKMEGLPGGGQRFIFSFLLMNGCRACEVAGHAEIAFDFDSAGRFVGSTLVRLNTA